MEKNYYLGLDIGTDSVGWAVTDASYNISKFKGNSMWGIRLFDESKTAQERRAFRSSRRRAMRQRERLNLLEMLFDEEISKNDISFFQRLKESNLYLEDKSDKVKYCVFNDEHYSDKNYHIEYPTIYHLRKELIENPSKHDVRLVYIALHHIIKNRGHFLFDSLDAESVSKFSQVYDDLCNYLSDNFDINLSCADIDSLELLLKNKTISKINKNKQIFNLFNIDKKDQAAYCLSLLSGSKIKLSDIFNDDELINSEKNSISFSDKFDDNAEEIENILGERYELIEKLKAIYDWSILADILDGNKYLSYGKVKIFDKHKNDLTILKSFVKEFCPEKYNEIFKISKDKLNNYVAYSGHSKRNGKTSVLNNSCNQEDFCKYLKKALGKCEDEKYKQMFNDIDTLTFMPKQVSKDNSVIPMQINKSELIAILNNARKYLEFINFVDENGLSVYDKIISLFDYRIPYYVGPLNTHSKNSWVVRSNEKIYPWNIRKVVDFDKSAEEFINNLTSKCSYLVDKNVIPKNSLLYSKFMVLNELNNLKIDGEKIDVSLKQDIYNDLFKTHNKVTIKMLNKYLSDRHIDLFTISGIDNGFNTSLKSLNDLAKFDLSSDDKEEIIKAITIFGDDKKLLKNRLRSMLSKKITNEELQKLVRLKYVGWGRLSKEFLTDVYCINVETGEQVNIITALWETNDNLMQILYSDKYVCEDNAKKHFIDKIEEMNTFDTTKSLNQIVEELYVSPKVKRPIYQSLLITKEIAKTQQCAPKKIFVEVARGEEKKERKLSRKQQLLSLYESCKLEEPVLYEHLQNENEQNLKRDALYLYYTQFGKCMYTGNRINLEDISKNLYDIDHIIPQSKIKDDSLTNRVLVDKVVNQGVKKDIYPISSDIQNERKSFWSALLNKKMITKEKYDRLTRKTPLTDEELSAFISRQLVETRQSTKAVAEILKQLYPDTEIVYVKASLVSEFRHKYDLLKCREVNDYHHAKDAYLNIVVGNVYNEKCTKNKLNFIKGLQINGPKGYSMNKIFDFNTDGAWVADNNKSIAIVKNTMNKNNILYTRYSYYQQGGFFDQMPVKKGKGQVPLKSSGPISNIEKYGAYNRPSSKYFSLVKYTNNKNKEIIQLVPIDAYKEKDYLQNPSRFVSDIVGFDAQIIMPAIKYNACLSFNGFRMHISSKSGGGSSIVYKPAVQLVLGNKYEKYIRNIIKYLSEADQREISEFDNLSIEENINIYDAIIDKLTTTIYSVKFNDLGNRLIDRKNIFSSLDIAKQCFVINELLKILHANVVSGDLRLINEAEKSGITTSSSKISEVKNIKSVKLINQSVTGLYENQIELLK